MTESHPELSFFDRGDGTRLAYRLRPGSAPTLLFLPGYASDMDGAKAIALDAFAGRRGLAMLRFDYSGTGSSGGSFAEGALDHWLGEALDMVDRLTDGPVVVIGSSMGGWIALHIALARPGRLKALVGVAAAPDFTDWGFTEAQKAEFEDQRLDAEPNPHLSRRFWRSGQQLRLLDREIAVGCPVRLIHGELDEEVPVAVALKLFERLRSANVQLNIVKGGSHRLSEPRGIEAIVRTVAALLEPMP